MKHIGTKVLAHAEPCNLGQYNKVRGWPIPKNEDPNRQGYFVRYTESYVSWLPKEEFEKVYRNIFEIGLDISQSLMMVKAGVAMGMARRGWNGKSMFVVYREGYPDGVPCNKGHAKAFDMNEGDIVVIRPHLQLVTADGSIAEWSPSTSDVLADDWMLVFTNDQFKDGSKFNEEALNG